MRRPRDNKRTQLQEEAKTGGGRKNKGIPNQAV